jgi:hypothetical protein
MKKLVMLTTAASLVLAFAAPGFAAQRAHRASDAYASGAVDRSGSYNYGPQDTQGRATSVPVPFDPAPAVQYNRGQNQPYPDRAYGDPGRW